jgi:hypothetical protein
MTKIKQFFLNRIFGKLINQLHTQYTKIAASNNDTKLLIGKLLSNNLKLGQVKNIHDAEFKVFSQWGDDGIIQYLLNNIDIPEKRFIEFGVADFTESNTRFLLLNDNWSGLVMDCSPDNVNFIKNDEIYWKYDLTALHTFATAENINSTLTAAGYVGEVGLLHIDVDGNEYWIWKAIDCISPVIAIIEYNSLFGPVRSITVPYDPEFDRMKASYSGLYAGASLPALCDLAHEKGYSFVGSNSAGNNAYFVRNDQIGTVRPLSVEEGYVASKFREHRDENGHLTFLSGKEAIKSIADMRVFNTRTKEIEGF